jgi:uroporphyrinogen decarboxylase
MEARMTHKERFNKVFTFQQVDRIPCYFFGSWRETKARWRAEGYAEPIPGMTDWNSDAGPQLPGMDPDWEPGLWNTHGLVQLGPIGDIKPCLLWEDETRRALRSSLGEEYVERKDGSSISHTTRYALEPTRESWANFKRFLETEGRYPADLEERAAAVNAEDRVIAFMGGSLYGWLRGWMGVENISYIMYDDAGLLEEMVAYLADHFIRLMEPVLKLVNFDFVYFFEDCCGSSGPLFSPAKYRELFDTHYRRMLRFYKQHGVPLALIDSDGWTEALIPCWRDSGFDILFPIEVGKWGADPADLRNKFGRDLCFFGAVNKNLIGELDGKEGSESKLREHLINLLPSVREGGFIPIPDHRIPPDVSYAQMKRYIKIFNEVFN